ncbi:AAA-like domain-containing protein [Prochlorothrix hollandica]|uniref:AAA-like domain-containing protein n=1 Tax=Prochlorothrix hollandica TaxID=1223 RepID=UPI0033408732
MNFDRLFHLDQLLANLGEQLAGLETALALAPAADKAPLKLRIRQLREEMQPFEQERDSLRSPTIPFGNMDATTVTTIRYPEGCEPLDSPFYVEVKDWGQCCQELQKPGGLVRIKSPQKMGKSSLLVRLLHKLEGLDCRSVLVDFGQASRDRLENPDIFIQWMCASLGRELRVPVPVMQCWDNIFGANDNATTYLGTHLLGQDEKPLVLAIDNFDRIFESQVITADLCGLLRGWHELAKSKPRWQRLRIVIAHSQDPYAQLDINQSPFNVGLPVQLEDLSAAQIQSLVDRHRLPWSAAEIEDLLALVGGQPYLVRLALYQRATQPIPWADFLAEAKTEAGIYGNYLRGQHQVLVQHPTLAEAMAGVVHSPEPIRVRSDLAFKLVSMGLVTRVGSEVQPRCQLYRDYWTQI